MISYIDEAVEEFTKDASTPVSSPAYEHLLTTREGKLLPEYQALLFYCLVEKLLFVTKRSRPDIQPPFPSSPHTYTRQTKTTGKSPLTTIIYEWYP